MSKSSPLLDDLMTLGGSLFGYALEARHDLKSQAQSKMDGVARKMNLVSREEFDVAFAMLSKARTMQEELNERLKRVEAKLDLSSGTKNKNQKKSSLPSVKQGKKTASKK